MPSPNPHREDQGHTPGPLPPRPDLAIGALTVALNITTDGDVKPWLQAAIDFLLGDYEPLES